MECAIPCINQYKSWPDGSIKRYNKIIIKADKITYVSDKEYFNGCMQKRNLYMVENSSLLIAVFNGSAGGTKSTIELANKKGVNVININP